MRSTKQIFFLIGIATQIVVLCISLFFLHNVHRNGNETQEEAVFSEYLAAEEEDSFQLRLPFAYHVTGEGKVLPSSGYIEITPSVEGEVIDVKVKAGDLVKEGDLLFKIDDAEYKFALKEKLAQYDASLAALKLLEEGPSRMMLEVKQKEIEQAKIKLAKSEDECTIFQTLFEKSAVTKMENEERMTEHAMLVAELDKILAEYADLQNRPRTQEVEIYKAHLMRDEANVHAIERKMKKCFAHAPISGRVLAVNTHVGERVSPGDRNTVIIGNEMPLHLKVHVDEKDAWRIAPNKGLRAIAVHKSNPRLRFILNFVSLTPLLDKSPVGERKLELTFSFDKGVAPIYLEELLDVYIEASSPKDVDCLDYQFSKLR